MLHKLDRRAAHWQMISWAHSQSLQVLGCVVKWRLAFGLAKARKAPGSAERE